MAVGGATTPGALAAFGFHRNLIGPSVAIGASQAGLYGLLAVALVLSFRVSRTVAFVHGGLAVVGALGYWILCYNGNVWSATAVGKSVIPGYRPALPGIVGLLVVTAVGAAMGAAYGSAVMGRRMARL